MSPRAAARLPLEACVCGRHFDCPDGWHDEDDLPCACTPDCVLGEDERDAIAERQRRLIADRVGEIRLAEGTR